MITLPGLIDPHTHPRGLLTDNYKEDFYSATSAALAGGFTTILDMPNNPTTPTLTYELLKEKQAIAKNLIVCDVGFIFGTNGKNLDEFKKVEQGSMGLKVFLSFSTGNLMIDTKIFEKVVKQWTKDLIVLLHAETATIEEALRIAKKTEHKIHICHVSSKLELQQIIDAKKQGINVTCGATPHHLFLNDSYEKNLGTFGLMKPNLKPQSDVDFLWEHFNDIDVIESDHAPHSKEEKMSNNPPFGVSGLETTLGLLLTAKSKNKITLEQIIDKCYSKPKKIFNIPTNDNTKIEIDENEEWTINQDKLFTKSKTSPFNGWKLKGRVKQVYIRGTKVFENGKILAKPGFGKILKSIV